MLGKDARTDQTGQKLSKALRAYDAGVHKELRNDTKWFKCLGNKTWGVKEDLGRHGFNRIEGLSLDQVVDIIEDNLRLKLACRKLRKG